MSGSVFYLSSIIVVKHPFLLNVVRSYLLFYRGEKNNITSSITYKSNEWVLFVWQCIVKYCWICFL